MPPVEPKEVMVALLGADATLVGFGLVFMSIVVAFDAAIGRKYPALLYIFFWLASLAVVVLALFSTFACIDWLVDHAYSHSAEVDGSFNIAVRCFDLTLFAVVIVALLMAIPFVVEWLGEKAKHRNR